MEPRTAAPGPHGEEVTVGTNGQGQEDSKQRRDRPPARAAWAEQGGAGDPRAGPCSRPSRSGRGSVRRGGGGACGLRAGTGSAHRTSRPVTGLEARDGQGQPKVWQRVTGDQAGFPVAPNLASHSQGQARRARSWPHPGLAGRGTGAWPQDVTTLNNFSAAFCNGLPLSTGTGRRILQRRRG